MSFIINDLKQKSKVIKIIHRAENRKIIFCILPFSRGDYSSQFCDDSINYGTMILIFIIFNFIF
jgi:hypothetical protein